MDSGILILKKFNFILVLFIFLFGFSEVQARFGNAAFWKRRVPSLKFTTSTQTIMAGNCSGTATVGNYSASNALTNVASNLTVNLSSSGTTTFFSDATCTTPITTVTITTGTSSASFYFIEDTVASITLTAAATDYNSGTQAETVNTNLYVWTGGGGNSLWATGGNWSGGSAPGSTNTALFNSICSSNCSPTLGANMSVGGIRMETGYGGTITQSSTYTITIGAYGYVQKAGTFLGSSSAAAITQTGRFALTGGTFQSTSGSYNFNSGALSYVVSGSPTFTANSGTMVFGASTTITPGTVTYNHVNFNGWSGIINFASGSTMTINGDLTMGSSGGVQMYLGTLAVAGNVSTNNSTYQGNTTAVKLTGNPAGQTITTGASTSPVANLELATGANPVTFSGVVYLMRNYTVTSVGTVTTTGSTVVFGSNSSLSVLNPGSIAYNNVSFFGYSASYDLNANTLTVNGDLTLGCGGCGGSDAPTINNGTINVAGNVTTTSTTPNPGVTGSAWVRMVGNASGQTITSSSSLWNGVPNLEIAAGANNVTFGSKVWITGSYKVTSVGSLTTAGSTLYLDAFSSGVTSVIEPGTYTYNNVILYDVWAGSTFNLNGGTMNIGGNLTIGATGYFVKINNGTVNLSKNFTTHGHASNGGSMLLNFVGSTDQTVTATSGGGFSSGNVTVNTTAGANLVLASAASFNNVGQTFTVTAGGVTMAGYALTLKSLSLNSTTVTKGGGTLTVNGSVVGTGSLYGGTIAP